MDFAYGQEHRSIIPPVSPNVSVFPSKKQISSLPVSLGRDEIIHFQNTTFSQKKISPFCFTIFSLSFSHMHFYRNITSFTCPLDGKYEYHIYILTIARRGRRERRKRQASVLCLFYSICISISYGVLISQFLRIVTLPKRMKTYYMPG